MCTCDRLESQIDADQTLPGIYDTASSIWYSNWQRPPWSTPWPGRDLWVHVRCSGGDNTGDPENSCGDRKDVPVDNPRCPPPPKDGAPKEGVIMQAYSNQSDGSWRGGYSRITFYTRFSNELRTLDEATQYAKRSAERQENLENWNKRAGCFFHEITLLAYFVSKVGTTARGRRCGGIVSDGKP
jgi:hypothetical protein